MALSREELLVKAGRRYATLEPHGVKFRSLTELETSNLEGLWFSRLQKLNDGESEPPVDAAYAFMAQQKSELLALTLVDDEGAPMFAANETDVIRSMDPELVDELYAFARAHCRMDKSDKAKELAEKKSDATPA